MRHGDATSSTTKTTGTRVGYTRVSTVAQTDQQNEALTAAANGRKGGRPRKVDDADAVKARQLRDKGITATDIAKMLGVSRATVYRHLSDGTAA